MSSLKQHLSLVSVIVIGIVTIVLRLIYAGTDDKPLKVTSWDALGYYQNLPAVFIYNDISKMKWFEAAEKKYDLSGGHIYQLSDLENGNRVGKYMVGVSIMQAPFFLIAHGIAHGTNYEADGFSAPYQWGISLAAIFYFLLGILLLRQVLLHFFSEETTAITLLLLALATNTLQYVSLEAGMSHGYIFFLYALLLYATNKWHQKPQLKYALLIGATIGFATICRATEAVMIFIPILWGMQDAEHRKAKWQFVRENKKQLFWIIGIGLLAITPQLIYWQIVTDAPIHKMGSKWQFFNPWFRVLFGFQKGWFIYTPITVFFIVGLFCSKSYSFQKSLIAFSVLNIWIIISWHEWQYGASYSTRALIQSYPVLALGFAAFIAKLSKAAFRYSFLSLGILLIALNLFQIGQYNSGALLGDGMNYKYYKAVFLKSTPTPRDVSLIYTEDQVSEERLAQGQEITRFEDIEIESSLDSQAVVYYTKCMENRPYEMWINVSAKVKTDLGHWLGLFKATYQSNNIVKTRTFPLNTRLSNSEDWNLYNFDFIIPQEKEAGTFTLTLETDNYLHTYIDELVITSGPME